MSAYMMLAGHKTCTMAQVIRNHKGVGKSATWMHEVDGVRTCFLQQDFLPNYLAVHINLTRLHVSMQITLIFNYGFLHRKCSVASLVCDSPSVYSIEKLPFSQTAMIS